MDSNSIGVVVIKLTIPGFFAYNFRFVKEFYFATIGLFGCDLLS